MDKKQLVTVSILGAVIVALVCFMVIYSGNTERLTKNQILRVEDEIYEISDLEKYMYISNEADGDIAKVLDETEKETLFNEYVQAKVYAGVADKKAILFPEEELAQAKSDFASKSGDFAKYGITEEDYIEYVSDESKMMNLSNNFGAYYELPEDVYQEFVDSYSGDELTTYSYRMMNFRYEEPESGESGDVLDEHEGHEHEEEEEDRSKDTMFAKAQTALASVKSGDDFETIANDYSDGTYTISQNSLVFLNGEIQYAIEPVLESKLGSTEVFEAVKNLKVGEYTDIIEVPDSTSYYFVKVENIEEGFVGEAAEEVKEQLLYEYQETLLIEDLDYEANQAALVRFLYK